MFLNLMMIHLTNVLNLVTFNDDSPNKCTQFGYTKTTCSSGNPANFCPYNNAYFKECCDAKYKYDKVDCSYPKTVSSDSCGGKYMCYCDKSIYPNASCTSPQVPSGDSCTEEGKTYYSLRLASVNQAII